MKKYPQESISINSTALTLSGSNSNNNESTSPIEAGIDSGNNLPTAMAYLPQASSTNEVVSDDETIVAGNSDSSAKTQSTHHRQPSKPTSKKSSKKTSKSKSTSDASTKTHRHSAMLSSLVEVSRHNVNLSEAEKEWLKWHQRFGHRAFNVVKHIMSTGVLAKSQRLRNLHNQVARRTECPKCAACCYARAKRRPVERTKTTYSSVRDQPKPLTNNILYPGQEVSVDHLVSSVPGRLYSGYGKGSKESMYKGSALFVDNATGYVEAHHQTALNTHETLRSKEKYESNCRDLGVVPQWYRSDNASVFNSHEYKAHLEQFSQTQKFAGVGQHHTNGIVEKAIQDIQSTARTMLVHMAIHWPDQTNLALWPMAIDHATFLHNHLPSATTGLSPMDKFSRQRFPHSKFHDIHVFGCPCYVLDKKIADEHWQTLFGDSEYQFPNLDTDPPALTKQPVQFEQPHPLENFDPSTGKYATTDSDIPASILAADPEGATKTEDKSSANPPNPPITVPSSSIERESDPVEREQATIQSKPTTSMGPTLPPSAPQLQREQQSSMRPPTPAPKSTIRRTTKSFSTPPPKSIPTEIPIDVPPKMIPLPIPKLRSPPRPSKEPPRTSAVPLRRSTRSTKGKAPPTFDPNPNLKTYAKGFVTSINQSNDPDFNDTENHHSFPKDSPFMSSEELVLTPKHPSYKRFTKQPESDDGGVCGFYDLQASYLGFMPEKAPKLLFLDSGVDPGNFEFLKAASSDPDTLSWDEAMSIPDEVQ